MYTETYKYVLVVQELWDWLGEQSDRALSDICRLKGAPLSDYRVAQVAMCKAVKNKMRTLFAGLIDFDE